MLLLYIGKTVNLLLLLGLFQRKCQVTLTRCDDMSNDSGINIDTIEEPHIEDFEVHTRRQRRHLKRPKQPKTAISTSAKRDEAIARKILRN